MLSPDLKSKISQLWDMFWSRGLSNPIQSIEQMSYLLFMRRLDQTDLDQKEKAAFAEETYRSIFDRKDDYRWSVFKDMEPGEKFAHLKDKVFPFIKTLNESESPFARHMENAVFMLPTPALLEDAMNSIDEIFDSIRGEQSQGQEFQDTQGDVYEYLLSELKESGKNGQFRTPRHLIRFLVELLDPQLGDRICDPASGTGGFLLAAYQYILASNSSEHLRVKDENGFFNGKGDQISDQAFWEELWTSSFYGFDIDPTMVRIGLMNLMLHGINVPHIENVDTLSRRYEDEFPNESYDIILANPPFTGKISKGEKSDAFRIDTNSTELLFLEKIVRMLETGGKAGVIIPEGVLFGSTKANKQLREILLKDCQMEAVISLPSGVFKPYTGVKTAILVFTKAEHDAKDFHTEKVWFYELEGDGYTLDDNRRKLKENPLPEAIKDWIQRAEISSITEQKGQHFYVSLDTIKANDYDLSFNRYKEFEYEEQQYDPPKDILANLMKLEKEILKDMEELNGLIG